MPITQFPYDGTLAGSDLSALLVGADLGSVVAITIHRDVSLAWDVINGATNQYQGRDGDNCWLVSVTEHTVIWSARITETVTKTTRPAPVVNRIGGTISSIGTVITGVGGALLTWSGIVALSPGMPAAPIGAAGGTIVAGLGGVVIGVGESLKWITDPNVQSWTTTYQESGQNVFTFTTYSQVECDPNQDYQPTQVPENQPTYEYLLSQCVSSIGTGLAGSGFLHPPR